MSQEQDPLYRVLFTQNEQQYEIYARFISEEHLMGFIQVEELVFTDVDSMVVDPSEEKLRHEFKGVKRSYIPLYSILRIDEVVKEGPARVIDLAQKKSENKVLPIER